MTTQEQWPLEAFAQDTEYSIDHFQWYEPVRVGQGCVVVEVRTGKDVML